MCTVVHDFYIASHLVTLPSPVCWRLRLSSCCCLSLSSLTGCCVAASTSPRVTASHPPGLTPLLFCPILLLPLTLLSPAVKVDRCIIFSIFWMSIVRTVAHDFYVALHLVTLPPPVCRHLRLLSCRCLSSSALTGCCVATSASPRATASRPPGLIPLLICHLLLLPLTSLSPAVKVD
jgi:hypothetical protein